MNEQKWCENVDPRNGRKCIRPLGHTGLCGGDGMPTHEFDPAEWTEKPMEKIEGVSFHHNDGTVTTFGPPEYQLREEPAAVSMAERLDRAVRDGIYRQQTEGPKPAPVLVAGNNRRHGGSRAIMLLAAMAGMTLDSMAMRPTMPLPFPPPRKRDDEEDEPYPNG